MSNNLPRQLITSTIGKYFISTIDKAICTQEGEGMISETMIMNKDTREVLAIHHDIPGSIWQHMNACELLHKEGEAKL